MTDKIVLCTLVKPEGASRIDSIPGYFEITAQYSRQYPYGEWTGDVHSDRRDFITPHFNGKPLTGRANQEFNPDPDPVESEKIDDLIYDNFG